MTTSDGSAEPGDYAGSWDPAMMRRIITLARPFYKLWFRSEVRGLDQFPDGGVLVVSNHSGGFNPPDVPVFWVDFCDKFGFQRPVYTLAHDLIFRGPAKATLSRMGMIRADRENAAKALRAGAVLIVFPGGDVEALRPTSEQAVIDFAGRTGYVTTALQAGVPIVPIVSIGAQETQLFLTRGQWLAKRLGMKRLIRAEEVPVSFGFPFGFSLLALNFPLPAKIVTRVLAPIDLAAQFGEDPDIAEVDEYVRGVMQEALTALAAERRFPILG